LALVSVVGTDHDGDLVTLGQRLGHPIAECASIFDSTSVATVIAERLVLKSHVIVLGRAIYLRKNK